SSTVGGASWLPHSTMQSGLFVNSQQRYDELLDSDRTSLSGAFKKAGWRIVGDDPSNFAPVPDSTLYDYDKFYDEPNVGYHGPRFSYATIPDQYTFNKFQENELDKPGHPPVMAEIDLVSSHSPWAPLPRMVPQNQLGDGSVFDPMVHQGTQPGQILSSAAKLQVAYGQSIQYSLTALIDYLKRFGDKNTVMIFLGDHQPAPIITGEGATHDVPTVIVAKDPKVIDAISSWGWDQGLRPGRNAPVWLMSTFRQKFFNAFDAKPAH
ncbi:MAG TPA: sulfatase-like hydrolase/transferase, partial [Pseudonocardiaceae bacterium]|nr:sulfatase-like hydrolase/transferase [Pseudonocardiaceae bacterium]